MNDFTRDPWIHVGALLAFGFGAADLWYFHSAVGTTGDVIFIVAGLSAFGVKIANGVANKINGH